LVHRPGYLYTTRDSGMSRTTIDYEAMLKHMSALFDNPAVKSDVRLSKSLHQCIADTKKWSAELKLSDAREKKDYIRLVLLILTNMRLTVRIAGSIYRVLKRRMWGA
jgi:hypothetical protein